MKIEGDGKETWDSGEWTLQEQLACLPSPPFDLGNRCVILCNRRSGNDEGISSPPPLKLRD